MEYAKTCLLTQQASPRAWLLREAHPSLTRDGVGATLNIVHADHSFRVSLDTVSPESHSGLTRCFQ